MFSAPVAKVRSRGAPFADVSCDCGAATGVYEALTEAAAGA
jgi:hypothetical protein